MRPPERPNFEKVDSQTKGPKGNAKQPRIRQAHRQPRVTIYTYLVPEGVFNAESSRDHETGSHTACKGDGGAAGNRRQHDE
jgi:hypothetical protein